MSADYDALVRALREMPPQMADAWGNDSAWLTTGTNVADLVGAWIEETIAETRVLPPATGDER